MKKILSVILVIAAVFSIGVFAFVSSAEDSSDKKYIHDDSDVLSDSEEASVRQKLVDMSNKYGVDVVIAFVPEDLTDAEAEAIYDDNGYGTGGKRNGIITVIITDDSLQSNTVISLCGALSDNSEPYYVISEFDYRYKDNLANHDYMAAIDDCIKAESAFLEKYNEEHGFHLAKKIIISLLIGFAVAGIAVLVMKSKLKSVGRQTAAASYVVPGSFNLVESRDLFLYANVSRTERASESTRSGGGGSHTSSGGVSHNTSRF